MALLTTHPQRAILATAACSYVAVFVLYRLFEQPGLGIGHLYYVSILLAARATGPVGGAVAGLIATGLYAVGIYWNPTIPVEEIATVATVIRLGAYVMVGVLAGYYAQRSRTLIEQAQELAAELRLLARRDFLTGLPNQRALEVALNRRLEAASPFSLILCELHHPGEDAIPTERLLDFSDRLTRAVDPSADVARISQDQFAVLVDVSRGGTQTSVQRIHQTLSGEWRITTGWASYPEDARDGLSLYGAASDRLYARKIVYADLPDPSAVTAT